MYILIALMTMTILGNYPTQVHCEDAIRQIYMSKLDQYKMVDDKQKKDIVDIQMRYRAPKEYRCQKI